MSTQRILLLTYIVLGLILALVLEQAVAALGGFGALAFLNRSLFGLEGWSYATLIAFGVMAGVGIFCWRDERVHGPAVQVVQELQRVTWPTLAETRTATYAVIVASFVCAILLGLFDYGWGMITQQVYKP